METLTPPGDSGELPVLLARIAAALERLAPAPPAPPDFARAVLHRYDQASGNFVDAPDFPLSIDLLTGVDAQKARLLENLRRFVGRAAFNNVLLWGARGAGKSSLAKAAVMAVARQEPRLKMVELEREVVNVLPRIFATLRNEPYLFVVLCDDLSFEEGAGAAKSLKSALEGGVLGPPANVMFLATSNRRHLMARTHEDGDQLAAREDADESISASDRFGLWLGFPPMDQAAYLAAVRAYAERFDLDQDGLERRALQWVQLRGGRSGRGVLQFMRDIAGEQGRALPV